MMVSVIVCTRNRCETLRHALDSLGAQDCRASDYEVVVVDNASTDSTEAVVSAFKKKSAFGVFYVMETRLGLSFARNRGMEEAKGGIVAFVDDDAKADGSWVSGLMRVYREEKDVACVGGPIVLDWQAEKPEWWHPDLDEVFNGTEYSRSRIRLERSPYLRGTNMSFRADLLKRLGGFRVDLGRMGHKLLAGEETDLFLRIAKEGHGIYYEPSALVHHRVESNKVSASYIRRRAWSHGESHALLELKHFGGKLLARRMAYRAKKILGWMIRGRYPLHEQNRYLFYMGYVFAGLRHMISPGYRGFV